MHAFPTPLTIKQKLPLEAESAHFIASARATVEQILTGKDPRKLLIVGPCSIHDLDACFEYAEKLKSLSALVEEHFFCIMRAYIEKPRTGNSWKGFIYDPYLNESFDTESGITLTREFLLKLAALGMPAATEFVTPAFAPYIEDLITWGCIGARTCSSQIHRLLASHLPMPMGIKNSVDGNIRCAAAGIATARAPHTFLHTSDEGRTELVKSRGNPYAHLVLRGSEDQSNYSKDAINEAVSLLRQMELPPKVIVDCSHGNSGRQYFKQKEVFESLLERGLDDQVVGLMIESHLEAGRQKVPSSLTELQRGVSITDGCLDYQSTEEMILSSLVPSLSS